MNAHSGSLRFVTGRPLWTLAAAVALVAFTLVAQARLRRSAVRRTLARRRNHAADGEERAEVLLVRAGYAIVGRQVSAHYALRVDEAQEDVRLRADFLVEAEGRRFVAEVKTGRVAPRIDTTATRRQLLEYRFAFEVEGVLLVDADAERIQSVAFPIAMAPEPPSRVAWLLAGVVVGALGAVAARAIG